MNDHPLIKLKNVCKTYHSQKKPINVLNKVSLDIHKATFTAIVGPSGAGKSTLLYLIGLLSPQNGGEIFIENNKVSSLSDLKKSYYRNHYIGFIFQNYHLLPEFTAIENIMLPIYLKGMSESKARRKALDLLKEVNLSERKDHKPGELSGGEQQRICICRALINDPKIILADEPTGNLDSNNSELVMNLLEKLYKVHGTSLVMVTHNENLSKMAQKIVHIEDGFIKN